MLFPISARGRVVGRSLDLTTAMSAVEIMLREARASSIKRYDDRIDFTAGAFRLVTTTNLLGPVGSGSITFRQLEEAVELGYRISFVEMLVIVSVIVSFFGLLPVIASGPREALPLPILILAWLLLFGGNYVITLVRFPFALRSALRRHHRTAADLSMA